MRKDRIQEILMELDCDCYGKSCNYLEFNKSIDNMPSFYSRDYCYNISFKKLLKWYIKHLGIFEHDYLYEDRKPTEKETLIHTEMVEKQLDVFMELIDIYSVYRLLSKLE